MANWRPSETLCIAQLHTPWGQISRLSCSLKIISEKTFLDFFPEHGSNLKSQWGGIWHFTNHLVGFNLATIYVLWGTCKGLSALFSPLEQPDTCFRYESSICLTYKAIWPVVFLNYKFSIFFLLCKFNFIWGTNKTGKIPSFLSASLAARIHYATSLWPM